MRAESPTHVISAQALGIGQLLAWGAAFYAVPLLLPRLAQERGSSLSELSLALTSGLLASALSSPWVVGAIERDGPRGPLRVGSCAALGALVWLALLGGREATLLGLFVLGASHAALLYEPVFAAITLHTRDADERVRAIQVVTLWGGFAGLWAIPLTSLLLRSLGLRAALLAMALALLVPLYVHARLPDSAAPAQPLASVASPRSYGGLPWAFALSTLAITSVSVHGPSWLSQAGVTSGAAAWAFALVAPAQVLGRLWLIRQSPARVVATACFPLLLVAASLLALLLLPRPLGLSVFVATFGAGSGLVTTARAALLSSAGAMRQLGLAGLATSLARAAAPACGAWLHESAGLPVTLLSLALVMMAAAGLLWRVTRPLVRVCEPAEPCLT